ncbi:MAG: DEAD/DEAH box helicase, partial [Pseudorhodoplanes sp.]
MALLDQIATPAILPDVFARWFAARGWAPRAHQLELLKRAREDKSVLLIAPTGGGKTLAGFLPTLVELSEADTRSASFPLPPRSGGEGLGVGGNVRKAGRAPPPPPPPP